MKIKPDAEDLLFARNLTLTREIVERCTSYNTKLSDPCVICGVSFLDCPHTVYQTQSVIQRVRKMTFSERENLQ